MSPLVEVTSAGPSQHASVGAITLLVLPAFGGPTTIAAQSAGVRNTPAVVCPAHTWVPAMDAPVGRDPRIVGLSGGAGTRACPSYAARHRPRGPPIGPSRTRGEAREREQQRDHGQRGGLGGQRGLSGRRGVASGERSGSGPPGGGVYLGSRGRIRGARTMPNASNMNATTPIATGEAPRTAPSG